LTGKPNLPYSSTYLAITDKVIIIVIINIEKIVTISIKIKTFYEMKSWICINDLF